MLSWIVYGILAIVTALGIAAYDNGKRWGVGKCMFLGAVWPISLFIIALRLVILKIKEIK